MLRDILRSPRTSLALMGTVAAAGVLGWHDARWFPWLGGACALALLPALRRLGDGLRLPGTAADPRRWGDLLLHAGLLLLIAAGLCTHAFQARGFLQLIEGEVFSGDEAGFLNVEKGPWAAALDVPFGIRLERFSHSYWPDGQARTFASDLVILRPAAGPGMRHQPVQVSQNHAFSSSEVRVYQSGYYGYTVTLGLRTPSGGETFTHFLLDKPGRPGTPARGGSDFPGTPYTFDLTLLPDRAGGSFQPVDPALAISVRAGPRKVYAGPVPPSGTVDIDGNAVRVEDIRHWSGLIVTRDAGAPLAYLGFLLCALGAAGSAYPWTRGPSPGNSAAPKDKDHVPVAA